jgi:hypothetical protein
MDDLQKFYDYFAKNQHDNGWTETPPLRLSLIAMYGSTVRGVTERPEPETTFPLSRMRFKKFHLDSRTMIADSSQPAEESTSSYEAHHLTDQVVSSTYRQADEIRTDRL